MRSYLLYVLLIICLSCRTTEPVPMTPFCGLVKHSPNVYTASPEYLVSLSYNTQGQLVKRQHHKFFLSSPPLNYAQPFTDSLVYSGSRLIAKYLKREGYVIRESYYSYNALGQAVRIRTYDNSFYSDYTHAITELISYGNNKKPNQITSARFSFIDRRRHPTIDFTNARPEDSTVFRRDTTLFIYEGNNLSQTRRVQKGSMPYFQNDDTYFTETITYSDYDDKQNPYEGLPIEQFGFCQYSANNFHRYEQLAYQYVLRSNAPVRIGSSGGTFTQQFSYDEKGRITSRSNDPPSDKPNFVYNCP